MHTYIGTLYKNVSLAVTQISLVSEDAGIEPRTVAEFSLTAGPLTISLCTHEHDRLDNTVRRREIIVRGQCVCLCCGGRTDSPGGVGYRGSIFWKTREIGLPSYNDLSTL